VLHELELAGDVGVEADEMDTALARVRRVAVGAPPAQQPVPVDRPQRLLGPGLGVEGVARVGPADVGSERTAEPARVLVGVAEVVGVGQVVGWVLGCLGQGGAIGPAPYHLGGQAGAGIGIGLAVAPAGLVDEAPEPVHVLGQLAQDQVAAVAPQVGPPGTVGPG
jgi:hypothetical protein